MWDGERKGQSRDSAVSSVISYLERQTPGTFQEPLRPPLFNSKWAGCTHTHTHSQMSHGAASVARREDSVRINHACLSRGAISGDIMPGQPLGLEIVYVQYLRATNVSFGCRFWSHWQRWKDGLQIVLNRQGVVQG